MKKVYFYKTNEEHDLVQENLGNGKIITKDKNGYVGEHFAYQFSDKPFDLNDENTIQTNVPFYLQLDGFKNPLSAQIKYLYEDYLTGKVNLNPSYQRDIVWSLEQRQFFLENLFNHKAEVIFYGCLEMPSEEELKQNPNLQDVCEILDGKQRLTTIFDFIENKFPLSNGKFFKDLCKKDVMFLLNFHAKYFRLTTFNFYRNLTLNEKIEIFLMLNEYGVKVNKEHLDKVKNMMK